MQYIPFVFPGYIPLYHCHIYISPFLLLLSYLPPQPITLHYFSWTYLFLFSYVFVTVVHTCIWSHLACSSAQESQPLLHSLLLTTHLHRLTWDKWKDPNLLSTICGVKCLSHQTNVWMVPELGGLVFFPFDHLIIALHSSLHALKCFPQFGAYLLLLSLHSKFWWSKIFYGSGIIWQIFFLKS